jgi:hypothetical protein
MNNFNPFYDRRRWEKISQLAGRNNDLFPQLSKLRLQKPLKNGINDYQFNFQKDFVNEQIGEVGLDRNDLFVPFSLGMFLQFDTLSSTANDSYPTGRAPLNTYPIEVSAASRGFLHPDHAEAIYNGFIEMKFNTSNTTDKFPMEIFRYVPETQPIVAKDADGAFYSVGAIPQYNIDKVMRELTPEYYIQGDVDTRWKLVFNGQNANFDIADAGESEKSETHQAYVTMLMIGALIKCGSNKPGDIKDLLL